MGFGTIIVGDEIIRGKRRDGHFAKVIEVLAARGGHLDWSCYLADDRARLVAVFAQTLKSQDVVFCFGGIGVTPDDHTRQAAAAAAGVALALHPDAEAEIRARFAGAAAETIGDRLQLGEFPVGSRIIPNPYNRIPGFSLADHHFFPGFPQMAHPMLEWVLDRYYGERFDRDGETERAIIVWEGNEGTLLPLMRRIEADYPGVSVFSLPAFASATTRRHLELGVRGDPKQVAKAIAEIQPEVTRLGFRWEEADSAGRAD